MPVFRVCCKVRGRNAKGEDESRSLIMPITADNDYDAATCQVVDAMLVRLTEGMASPMWLFKYAELQREEVEQCKSSM